MDPIDRLRELESRIPKQIDHIHTEEATKNAFVMPFISALGYDVFNLHGGRPGIYRGCRDQEGRESGLRGPERRKDRDSR